MNKIAFKHLLFILNLFYSSMIFSQVSNLGKLYISSDSKFILDDHFINNKQGLLLNNGSIFFKRNLTNYGTISYHIGKKGSIDFIGTSIQKIKNNNIINFYEVTFNNASVKAPFQIFGDLYVNHKATFSDGIIENDLFGGNIFFNEKAEYIINPSNESYINGKVLKIGTSKFEFPIGNKEHYRKIIISTPNDIEAIFSASYFLEESNSKYPHVKADGSIAFIDTSEYWVLKQEKGNSELVITLTWDVSTTSSEILSGDKENIHIVRWDVEDKIWVDEGGVVDIDTQSVSTFSKISEYGVFTLARVKKNSVLPGNLRVYNAISPNGDGFNDYLRIGEIEKYPNNIVEIFNRWGTLVYKTTGYNNKDNVFRGVSIRRFTYNKNEKLPTGTYFYVLSYEYNSKMIRKQGHLYINDN